MAESITLARPYAKAAFELALEKGELAAWSEQLALTSAFAADEDMQDVLSHPGLTDSRKAEFLMNLCDGKLNDHVSNFLELLSENDRLVLLPEIAELFEQLKSQQEATVDVTVETAFELTSEQEQKLAQSLENKLARKVNLRSEINKDLLGGVVVRAGDLVIDNSVRGRLAKLAESITS